MAWLHFMIYKLYLRKAVFTKRPIRQCLTELGRKRLWRRLAALERRNQINLIQWLKVRVVDLLKLDSSSYTNLGKLSTLSKPKFLHLDLIRVAVRIKGDKCKTQECTTHKSTQ